MFMCIYRPPSQNKQYFLEKLSEILYHFSSIYDNYIILGDFNMEPRDSILKAFTQSHNLFNLIKSSTCCKESDPCVDLILTNRNFCFKNSSTFATGLSDQHHLIYSILKATWRQLWKVRSWNLMQIERNDQKIFQITKSNEIL